MKKIIIITLSLVIVQSCAFDQKEYVKIIVGKYSLRKTLNSENVLFEYQNVSNGSTGLVDGCQLVKFDTLHDIIYITQDRNHFAFKLDNPNSVNNKPAYTKSNLDEKDFKSTLDSCVNCVTYYPTNDF